MHQSQWRRWRVCVGLVIENGSYFMEYLIKSSRLISLIKFTELKQESPQSYMTICRVSLTQLGRTIALESRGRKFNASQNLLLLSVNRHLNLIFEGAVQKVFMLTLLLNP